MFKGLHSILINIQGGKVGTVEIPFIGCYSNSSITENKMHTVCLCTGTQLCVPNVPSNTVNSPYGNFRSL